MLKLLRGWLRAGVFEDGIVSAIEAGTPPGLANLTVACATSPCTCSTGMGRRRHRVGELVRYAEVILCVTREQAEEARELVAAILADSGCDCTRRRPGSCT